MIKYDERNFGEKLNNNTSYFRIGIYKKSRQFGHENICDVHFTWPAPYRRNENLESRNGKKLLTIPPTWKVWYSGPNDTIRQIPRPERIRDEIWNYDLNGVVPTNRDIGQGGQGMVISVGNWPQTKPHGWINTNKVHVWLFGPLLVENRPYGSLLFELTGPFVRDMVFRPLRLLGSHYSGSHSAMIPPYRNPPSWDGLTYEQMMERQQRGEFPPSDYWENLVVETYNARVNAAFSVPLSDSATQWEWTVEGYSRNTTSYKAYRISG